MISDNGATSDFWKFRAGLPEVRRRALRIAQRVTRHVMTPAHPYKLVMAINRTAAAVD